MVLLNTKNQVVKMVDVYTGSLNSSLVRVSEIFKEAVRVNAAAIIVAHNHPSGDPTPSRADIDLTLKIQRIGEDLGITLHDHVIIGKGKHSSFKAMGIL